MSAFLAAIAGLAAGAAAWPAGERVLQHALRPQSLENQVLWGYMPASDLVALKDGSYMAVWETCPPDLSFRSGTEADALSRNVNTALMTLSKNHMAHLDQLRVPSLDYRTATGKRATGKRIAGEPIADAGASASAPAAALLCERARAAGYAAGEHFEDRTFIALTYTPPTERQRKAAGLFYRGGAEEDACATRVRKEEAAPHLQRFEDLLGAALKLRRLEGPELAGYLRATLVGGRPRPIALPPGPAFLDFLFAERIRNGFEIQIGDQWARVVCVQGYGHKMNLYMGMTDALRTLPFPYRFSSRLVGTDASDALKFLEGRVKSWTQLAAKGVMDELFGGGEDRSEVARDLGRNKHAESQSQDASDAKRLIQSGESHLLHATFSVVVMHENLAMCNERARQVENVLQAPTAGFVAARQRGMTSKAWLGTLPGHGHYNVRRHPMLSHEATRPLPLSSDYMGPKYNPCGFYGEEAAPLFYAETKEHVPYRFTPYGESGDVGHQLVIGPTGTGKSILLGYEAMRHLHYPRAQAVLFDNGSSFAPLCEALGGVRYDVMDAAIQPLARIEDPAERRWVTSWVLGICRAQDAKLSPDAEQGLAETIRHMATLPPAYRTMQELRTQVQDQAIKGALLPFCGDGQVGGLMNAAEDAFAEARLHVIELGELIEMELPPELLTPILLYYFHRTESLFSPKRPTLVAADEFIFLIAKTEIGADYAQEAFLKYRKRNALIAAATQDPAHFTSDSMSAVVGSAKTELYLPNSKAKTQTQAKSYRALGLSEREITLVAEAVPKREYICKQPGGTRKFNLALAPELAFLEAAPGLSLTGTAHKMRSFKAEHGEAWITEWLRFRGMEKYARFAPPRTSSGRSAFSKNPVHV